MQAESSSDDDDPPGPQQNRQSTWSPASNWVPHNLAFTQRPGPTHRVTSDVPADYFELFFDSEIVATICEETNRYADQQMDALRRDGGLSRHSRFRRWKPTTPTEIKKFFGLLFLTGLVRKSDLDSYWSTDELIATPYFSRIMPRNRFEILLSFLNFSDNAARPSDCSDRLYRVRHVFEKLCGRFREHFNPGMPSNRCYYQMYHFL